MFAPEYFAALTVKSEPCTRTFSNALKPKPYTTGLGLHKDCLLETGSFYSEKRQEGCRKSREFAESQPSIELFSKTRQLLFQVFDLFPEGCHFALQEAHAVFFAWTTKRFAWRRRHSGNVFYITGK